MAKCSVCDSEEFESDLSDFSTEDIIDHLKWESLSHSQLKELKEIVKDTDESFADEVLAENSLYQKIISLDSATDRWKIEIVLENLDKYTYAEICEMFEKK